MGRKKKPEPFPEHVSWEKILEAIEEGLGASELQRFGVDESGTAYQHIGSQEIVQYCQRIEPFGLLVLVYGGRYWIVDIRLAPDETVRRLKEIEELDKLKDKIGGIQKIVGKLR